MLGCFKNNNNPSGFLHYMRRFYHSKKGVFGYRPTAQSEYKVSENVLKSRNAQSNVYRWVEAFRKHGHKFATVNPISINEKASINDFPELDPTFYGLQREGSVQPEGLLNAETRDERVIVSDLEQILKNVYCGTSVSAEFSYIENLEEREWLAINFEQLNSKPMKLTNDHRRQIAELLIKAEAWENFMAVKYPTVKRYGGEGAESLMSFFWQLLHSSVEDNVENLVIGMPHRGRLALQTALLNMRPARAFRMLNGASEFGDEVCAMADHFCHFHISEDLKVDGKSIHVCMLRNPSHLEAVNPIAMGKTRSKQQTSHDGAFSDNPKIRFGTKVLNVISHGDAAFAGQGVNQECLNTAYVPHFEIGGTIHLVVNNQLGFTTPADRGRSTTYATDLAKTIEAPVFHVNGDDPEMVALITQLSFQYQRKFRKDVFVDMNCFRRWGHNEIDDPTFTNPAIYHIIHNRKSVPILYAEKLIEENVLSNSDIERMHGEFRNYLDTELANTSDFQPPPSYFEKQWSGMTTGPDAITYWDTGLDYNLLHYIGQESVTYPDNFNVHPHLLKTHIEARRKKLDAGEKIDWATGEALAFGSLIYQGYNVRLSGEDVGRGTFSHRHVMLVDQKTNEMFIPLNELKGGNGGKLEIAHSILSEEAVLGFEYGMAIDNPHNLIIWEAQFGDFANGAQIMIDNYIASGETKWMDSNGLVILLPHGYDGAASEHSSCRIERFLQLCDSKETGPDGDNVNLHIVQPTTPAQYYHVLRRQMLRNFRKPLIVVSPKTLLRLSAATSTQIDFQSGTQFRNVLGDDVENSESVRKVILCSGRHYYNLTEQRAKLNITNVALIRLESLSPFPLYELQQELAKYPNARTFIWSQEEHRNMGAWNFVRPRFEYLMGKRLMYCGRNEAATSATGINNVHKREVTEIITEPFKI